MSVETVDILTAKLESMSTSLSTLQKDVAGAVKSATTVGNKQEVLSAQIKELTKKLKNVSDKVN